MGSARVDHLKNLDNKEKAEADREEPEPEEASNPTLGEPLVVLVASHHNCEGVDTG